MGMEQIMTEIGRLVQMAHKLNRKTYEHEWWLYISLLSFPKKGKKANILKANRLHITKAKEAAEWAIEEYIGDPVNGYNLKLHFSLNKKSRCSKRVN
jgi:hypothetical protein